MKGRFAPSPTGYMHLGNIWVALLSYWSTRQERGTYVVRIEDIDTQRCRRQWGEQALDELEWLGFTWDEGPRVGGPNGSYWQSERYGRYETILQSLTEQGDLYECFCNRSRLQHIASAPHADDEVIFYDGACRNLSEIEREARRAQKQPSWRIRMQDCTITTQDRWQGTGTYRLRAGNGDMVLRRADGMMAYALAVVVDDHDMGITEVVRGTDLLTATSEQIWLYQKLGWTAPTFGHVPLLVDSEGHRLSKRQQSISVAELRQQGYTASQIIGRLALAGGLLSPAQVDARHGISVEEIIRYPLPEAALRVREKVLSD